MARSVKFVQLVALLALVACLTDAALFRRQRRQIRVRSNNNNNNVAIPKSGDLLIGREHQLTASSTCGSLRRQRYCVLGKIAYAQQAAVSACNYCDSMAADPNDVEATSFSVENVVTRSEQSSSWWQSEPGNHNVSIEFRLESVFLFSHLVIIFKTFRPQAMYIQKSSDYGKTWMPYRYFAQNCIRYYPQVPARREYNYSDIVCDSRFSSPDPITDGNVHFRLLNPSITKNPYLPDVQKYTKFNALRIVFERLYTFGDEQMDASQNDKYYYAIKRMHIYGTCFCHGWAAECIHDVNQTYANGDYSYSRLASVGGKCKCRENTKPPNCDECSDLYRDSPWTPGVTSQNTPLGCKKCECNGHADYCVFNQTLFEKSGNVSGGVCSCIHNTVGRFCEKCRLGYYRNPDAAYEQPDSCLDCTCDTSGTVLYDPAVVDNQKIGICFEEPNNATNEPAGQCQCKPNVQGTRCDSCKNGYYGLSESDPNGCKKCNCHLNGTKGNEGCDKETGNCECKQNVMSQNCDTCADGFFNIDAPNEEGCEPCDCDLGGSKNNICDKRTGQCVCKDDQSESFTGRRCDQLKEYYFARRLDTLVLDADSMKYSGRASAQYIDPTREWRWGMRKGWSFVRMALLTDQNRTLIGKISTSDETLTTDLIDKLLRARDENDEPTRFNVFPVVRYSLLATEAPVLSNELPEEGQEQEQEAQAPVFNLDSVPPTLKLRLTRLDRKASILCNDVVAEAELSLGQRETDGNSSGAAIAVKTEVFYIQDFCLEPNSLYDVEIILNEATPADEVLQYRVAIDFVSFVPTNPVFSALMKDVDAARTTALIDEYETNLCREYFVNWTNSEETDHVEQNATWLFDSIPEVCRSMAFTFSAALHGRGFQCECNEYGSGSMTCFRFGGQCPCNVNILGRTCSQCVPRGYGFGTSGCQLCECSASGATSEFCDANSGQCNCITNARGRDCGLCDDGKWGFPRCEACNCSGAPEVCTGAGVCTQCPPETIGSKCEQCKPGYFGDPVRGTACLPCKCPGGVNNTLGIPQHATTCQLATRDDTTFEQCNCPVGYKGAKCTECAENYFGLPSRPGGKCERCDCSNNIDLSADGNCDRQTGQCLKCLYNTVGDRCEMCREGHWGNPFSTRADDKCKRCSCHSAGTLNIAQMCNNQTGDCACHPNVEGRRCDRCTRNYYNISSGSGCQPCLCDPVGARSPTCSNVTGKCDCKPGYGGVKCSDCEEGYFGDPNSNDERYKCQSCNCSAAGSVSSKCHPRTGQCPCKEGITGEKCDQCARGATGIAPKCVSCGECFKNWDAVVDQLNQSTVDKLDPLVFGSSDGNSPSDSILHRFVAEDAKLHSMENTITQMEQTLRKVVDLASSAELKSDAVRAIYVNASGLIGEYRQLLGGVTANLTQLQVNETLNNMSRLLNDIRTELLRLRNETLTLALKTPNGIRAASEQIRQEVTAINTQLDELSKLAAEQQVTHEANLKGTRATASGVNTRALDQEIRSRRNRNRGKMSGLSNEICTAGNVEQVANESNYLGVCRDNTKRIDSVAATLKKDSLEWLNVLDKSVFREVKALQLRLSAIKIKFERMALDSKASASSWNESYQTLLLCEVDVQRLKGLSMASNQRLIESIQQAYLNVLNSAPARNESSIRDLVQNLDTMIAQLRELVRLSVVAEDLGSQAPGVNERIVLDKNLLHNLTTKSEQTRDAAAAVQNDETLKAIKLNERNATLSTIESTATRALVNVTREEQQLVTTLSTANAQMDLAEAAIRRLNTTATESDKKLNQTEMILQNLEAAKNTSTQKIATVISSNNEFQQLKPYFETIKTNLAKLNLAETRVKIQSVAIERRKERLAELETRFAGLNERAKWVVQDINNCFDWLLTTDTLLDS